VLADQPREILDRAFLSTRDPVAIVQQKNHGERCVLWS
jgi:hypothetical protein